MKNKYLTCQKVRTLNKLITAIVDKGMTVGFDLETTGLDQYAPDFQIVSASISWKSGYSICIPWYHRENSIPRAIIHEEIKRLLSAKNVTLTGHGIKYDLLCLRVKDIICEAQVFDTLVALHLLNENYPKHDRDLKSLSHDLLGWKDYSDLGDDFKQKPVAEKLVYPLKKLTHYNNLDADATRRIYKLFKPELEKQGLTKLMKFQMEVLKELVHMEHNGFKISFKNLKKVKREYKNRIIEVDKYFQKKYPDVNFNSPKQLQKLLFEDLKIQPVEKTKTGWSTAEFTLEILETRGIPIAAKIMDSRRIKKLYTQYLVNMRGYISNDGLVHANFKQDWTVTGRFSCENPPMQTIPREGDIKKIFISRFPGGKLIQADGSQMELRVMANESRDPRLIRAYLENRDLHRETAAKVFGKPEDEITLQERKYAKQVSFGVLYLIGPKGLSRKLKKSEEESAQMISNWFKSFPKVKTQQNIWRKQILERGFVQAGSGRKRRFRHKTMKTGKGREEIRQGCNFPIQCMASEITVLAMIRLEKYLRNKGYKSLVIGNVHDAILIDSPKDEIKKVSKIVKFFGEDTKSLKKWFDYDLHVPLEFEIKTGSNWNKMGI